MNVSDMEAAISLQGILDFIHLLLRLSFRRYLIEGFMPIDVLTSNRCFLVFVLMQYHMCSIILRKAHAVSVNIDDFSTNRETVTVEFVIFLGELEDWREPPFRHLDELLTRLLLLSFSFFSRLLLLVGLLFIE